MYSKVLFFLDKADKRMIVYLLILFVFVGMIEVAGVLSIMPFVGMITNPDYFGSNSISMDIKNYLSISNKEFTLLLGILFVALFLTCSFLNGLTVWLNTRLSAIMGQKISSKLFDHYLSQSYEFFVKNDKAYLSKNIIEVSVSLSESLFIPALQILARLIILLFISILLININPTAFVSSLLMISIIYLFIFRVIKNRLNQYGKERLIHNDMLFKSASDCLNSIKDVKFYNIESFFSNIFSKSQKDFLDLAAKNIIISMIPKYVVEIIAFGSIFITLLYLQYNDFNLAQYTPEIALFILAAYRLLPSIQQIFAFTASIKFNLPALDLIHKDMNTRPSLTHEHKLVDIDEQVIFNNINFSYDNNKNILSNINMNIHAKTYNAIIGESGSGKTTLIDLLLGLYQPVSGTILLSNSLYDKNTNKLLIGYVSQNSPFIDDSILNNIAFGIESKNINIEKANKLINICGLSDLIKTLPNGIDSTIGDSGSRLSGGQLQRIAIARALYRDPAILILDEATNALDIDTEKELFRSIKSIYLDMTVICITHRLSTMRECNNIFHLVNRSIKKICDEHNIISDKELSKLIDRYKLDEKK